METGSFSFNIAVLGEAAGADGDFFLFLSNDDGEAFTGVLVLGDFTGLLSERGVSGGCFAEDGVGGFN